MSGQLIPRGANKWLIRIYLGREGGKRQYYNETVYGTKREAEKRRVHLLAKADEGLLLKGTGEVDTVEAFSEVWVEQLQARGLRERTIQTYQGQLSRRIIPLLGEMQIRDIDADVLKKWIGKLQKEGLSPRTVRLAFEVLRNLLESAVDEGLLAYNPAKVRAVTRALPRQEKKERVTIPAEKVADFLDAADEGRFSAIFHILLLGGLRPSEALALRWSDVDPPNVRVARVLVDKAADFPKYAPPKSKRSARTVQLPARAATALEEHRKAQEEEKAQAKVWVDPELVFTDEAGQALRQQALRYPYQKLLEKAGLPKMRLYDLRHSCATLLLGSGEDLELVKQRLGHSTITLTSDTYGGVAQGLQERAASALDALTGEKE